jgi:chromosome segregation ATPase
MTIEEIRRRLDEHHERLRQQDDYNKRMDLRQEFFAESTESLNAQLSELGIKMYELGAKVDRMAEKVDSLSDLWGEISRLVLQHNGRIERLESKSQ